MFFFSRRFLPLFVTQFLGALNDNLLKNAMLMLVTYRLSSGGEGAQLFTTLAGGVFILPFFLFSATAGILADAIDRQKIARAVKLAEIGIMAVALVGLLGESRAVLLLALFLMGMHSTFFGPVKYSLLPQHLKPQELLAGNAYVEAGSFLAILIGTIAGGLLVLGDHGESAVAAALLAIAVIGYAASRMIPAAPAPHPGLRPSFNVFRETGVILRQVRRTPRVFRSILGISWFWLLGAAFLSQFPPFARDVLFGEGPVVTLLLTVFSLGIGIGSILCNRLLRGQVQTTYVPLAALGMSVFMVDLYFASRGLPPQAALRGVADFLSDGASWRILFDLGMIALCGGVYTVPLYALMQQESASGHQARTIAANNVMNALFMVVSAVVIVILIKAGVSIPQMFLILGLLNLLVAGYIVSLLPDALLRSLMRIVFRLLYRVEVGGLEHYAAAGERVLLIANHTSLLDAALIAAFLPEKLTFAVNTHIARKWWMKPLLLLVDAFPLDPTNPLATKALIDALKAGGKVMIFPEGRITVTGSLMKVYEGPGLIADKAEALILPIRIDGAQYTPFSYLRGKARLRWFPKIRITLLPPHHFSLPDDAKGRRRRQLASAELYRVMAQMMFETSPYRRTLFSALLEARRIHGASFLIAEDIERHPYSYRRFIQASLTLGQALSRRASEPSVGVLLPTSVAMALALFGLSACGKVPALLNFTAGAEAILSACRTASLKQIVTSRRFIAQAKLDPVVAALEAQGIVFLYLEDVRREIGIAGKLAGAIAAVFPAVVHHFTRSGSDPDAPAVILFTSGSEGMPKGVVLSHANLLANLYQLASVIDFNEKDILFNCLPMFHAFGLTGGTLLPILGGMRSFFYPSPLHYRIVPELVYDTNATLFFGTDTFLAGYAKTASPYDFYAIRYIFAGAERLKDETRRTYLERFGLRILEGYGATETAPVLSFNTPMHYREGTVGRLLPAIEGKLLPVPGIPAGGQLQVRGPNILRGYLKADRPGVLQPPEDGWYDTGDIVTIDEDGFVRIQGRTKRFAKIAGEMVSLSAVEAAVGALWPEAQHAAINLPDAKKGEQIVLLTTHAGARRDALQRHFRDSGISDLAVPKTLVTVEAIPLLGTGKTDYTAVCEVAQKNIVAEIEPVDDDA